MFKTKKILSILFLLTLTLGLGACGRTVRGAGQDIEHAGQSVQNSVE